MSQLSDNKNKRQGVGGMRIDNPGIAADVKQHGTNQTLQHNSVSLGQENGGVQGENSLDKAEVIKAVERFNNIAEPMQTNLKFKYHEKLHEYYVEVVDTRTDEVVKEIPSRKVLDMYAAMTEFMGIFEDRKL